MSALNRMLRRDLWALRAQAAAAALVVACGIASLVAMRSTYHSLLAAQAGYYRAYRLADVFASLKRAPESVAARIRALPGVADVRTRVVVDVTLDVPGLPEPATGRLVSVPPTRVPMLNGVHLREGRWMEPGRSDEVVASEAFARANGLGVGDHVGAIVNGRWKRLRVVGTGLSPEYVYEVGGGALFPDNRRFGVLWMSRDVLGPAFDLEGAFNDVTVGLAAGGVEADVIAGMDALLDRWGGLGAYGRADQLSHRFLTDEIGQNRVTSTWIPAVFLGVAAFLLHIVLTRLVALQRAQIGLLKAFGYGDARIALHYLGLALAVVSAGVAVGGAAGLYLGGALTALYRDYYHFPRLAFAPSWPVAALTVAASGAAAAIGAWLPVRRAARLPPAEAMRPQTPQAYRHGVLERLAPYRRLPASVRMLARGIARRPAKSALSVLSLALAVGIMVVGGFMLDAIRELVRIQFEVVQRDDVTVHFHEPRARAVRHELLRLPGVLRAEPFRSVPVRLRHEHRVHRGELTGLVPGAELRRLLDVDLEPVSLPPDGIVLTAKLARLLGVVPGDGVQVEALEGARPVRRVPVAAVVDEPVGTGSYMDADALARLLREDRAVSGAHLLVDPARQGVLYGLLKRTPAVAAVGVRQAQIDSFQDILDRSIALVSTVNVVFACVIAFGIVYNGARIALSERGNELASLRVLGFTRGEVTAILLGEQGLFTVAALAPGFALGWAVCALLVRALDTELYRIPLVVDAATYALAAVVVAAAAALSGVAVAHRVRHLDLVAVLKTRET